MVQRNCGFNLSESYLFCREVMSLMLLLPPEYWVYKMNFKKVIEYHAAKGADLTIVYKNIENEDLSKYGVMQMDEDKRVIDFEEKPL